MMSKDATAIWFVTWPDGKVMERTQTSVSEDMACANAVSSFLPTQWFPGIKLSSRHFGPLGDLWRAMQTAGFKVQRIELTKEMADGVSY